MKKRIGQLVGAVGIVIMVPGLFLWMLGLLIAFGVEEATRRAAEVFNV